MNRRIASIAFVVSLSAVVLLAQYQVNRQIYGNPGPSSGSVRYSPQYLGGALNVPSSSRALPSETRNAYVRSGELPSNIKMSYNAVGPLAPGGALAYIPPPTQYRASSANIAPGNYVDSRATAKNMAPPQQGSVRYNAYQTNAFTSMQFQPSAPPTPTPGVRPAASPGASPSMSPSASPAMSSSMMNPFGGSSNGSIRYSQ